MKFFPLHATDFYKVGHVRQYPNGTEKVYSNFTPRSDNHANVAPSYDHKVVNFGLQGVVTWLLRDAWNEQFFRKSKTEVLKRYKRRMDLALGAGAVSTDHIAKLWELGYLPIHIKSLPEGDRVNIRVPLWTITNTDPEFGWLTNYLETQLSSETWKMITSATTAYEYRRVFDFYADITGADKSFIAFQGHDFSFRGMSGIVDATQSGAAHLLSFKGTDTISAIDYLEDYYYGDSVSCPFIGGSVPATEHSVMCMGGEDDEVGTIFRLIHDIYPSGIVSIVSDSWDYWKVLTEYAVTLKPQILAREGKVVFRPDSGDPVKIIVGDPSAPEGSPEFKGSVEVLWDTFGGTETDKGYRVLDSHVGLIYGDSISLDRADQILDGLMKKGFASSNIVFGIGSYTYQYVTRDTFGTAIKATYGVVNEEPRNLCKNPKTDSGMKKSAKGLLRVEKEGDDYVLYDEQTEEQETQGELKTVFLDGRVAGKETLQGIRERLGTA